MIRNKVSKACCEILVWLGHAELPTLNLESRTFNIQLSLARRAYFWLDYLLMRKVGLGLIGCGVVGGGVVKHLQANGDLIRERSGVEVELKKIAVRDAGKKRGVPSDLITTDWREVVRSPEIGIVVELMGGVDTAYEVSEAALRSGKSVVTANKALLAERGESLFKLAEENKAGIHFEASVGGGIPIVKALREGLVANHIRCMHGIINGTCNYIMTEMLSKGTSFEATLAEAKRLGYAEADESLDVDGIDAAHKAVILASLAYGYWIPFEHVYVEGIRKLETMDFEFADKLGYVPKLLAIIKICKGNAVETRVHPTLVPKRHVLASVDGVYNAVAVEGDIVGSALFYGRGAGADPTASAVLSDIIEAAVDLIGGRSDSRRFHSHELYGKLISMDQVRSRYYTRLTVLNQPGVLAQVAEIFGKRQVGISSVLQPEDHNGDWIPLVMMLEQAQESVFQQAMSEIKQLEAVQEPCQIIRVEDFS